MRLVVASLLIVLVSSDSLRRPLPPPGRLTEGIGRQPSDALDTLRLIQSKISNVMLQQQNQATRRLDQMIATAEGQADQLLLQHGSTHAVAAVHQTAEALHALADGTTGVEAGLQSALTEMVMVLRQLGAASEVVSEDQLEETTTSKSEIDVLLEELQALVDTYIYLIAPIIGLTERQANQIRKEFDKFVADVEALEHGQVAIPDGLEAMVTDILEILRILGIDWTAPTDDTPTSLDTLLAELDSALTAVLDILGPLLGFTREQTEALDADIDTIVADIEAIEHGHIDLVSGLEVVLQDFLDMLHDFGLKSQLDSTAREARGVAAQLAVLERRLTGLVTSLPPATRATVRTDLRQLAGVVHQLTLRLD